MATSTSSMAPARPSLSAVVTRVMFKLVSRHARRLFYIASLSGQIDHYSQSKTLAIGKLNEVMQLAHREGALRVPEGVRSQMWQGTGLEEILNSHRLQECNDLQSLREVAKEIVDATPQWAFGTEEEMINDVTETLQLHRSVLLDQPLAA